MLEKDICGSEKIIDFDGVNLTTTNNNINCTDWTNSSWVYTYPYWPAYQEDKTKKAFEVIKLLMDKKVVKVNTVKQFVDLVDSIVPVL